MPALRSGRRPSVAAAAVAAFILVLACGLLLSRSRPDAYDTGIMAEVAHSLAIHHDVTVPAAADVFHFNSPYASYGVGMSLLMAPAFAVAPHLGVDPASIYMAINSVLLALTALVLFSLSRLLGVRDPRRAAAVAVVVVLASPLLAYASTGLSEIGCGLGVAVGLFGLSRTRTLHTRGGTTPPPAAATPGAGAAVAGVGAGIAVLMRPDSLVLVVPVVGIAVLLAAPPWRLWSRPSWSWPALQPAVAFAAGLAPGLAVTGIYNAARFGSPLRFGYSNFFVFNHSFVAGLYGLTLSPARGLLLYAPIVVVAAAGAGRAWLRSPVLAGTALALLIVRFLFYAPYWSWSAGVSWGPRFLVPAMPALAVGLAEVVQTQRPWRRWVRAVAAAVIALSLGVQVVGAAVEPGKERMWTALAAAPIHYAPDYRDFAAVATAPRTVRIMDRAMFDWSLFPIPDSASQLLRGDNLVGRFVAPDVDGVAVIVLLLVGAAGAALAFGGFALGATGPTGTNAAIGVRVRRQ